MARAPGKLAAPPPTRSRRTGTRKGDLAPAPAPAPASRARSGRSKAPAVVASESVASPPSTSTSTASGSSAPVSAAASSALASGFIKIRGARTHNLRGVDLDLPRGRLVCITGPSGSGKSSLAFDTVFAEGQRRYVESLSVAARTFLAQLPKPDVDLVEGLSPTVAISQDARGRNPRSTVGTATEIHDFLRLLFARVGVVYSHKTGKPMKRHGVTEMVDAVLALPDDTRFSVLAPVVVNAAGDHAELLEDLRRRGFVRVAIDDEVCDLAQDLTLDPGVRHTIEVYVDRLKLKRDPESSLQARLGDSIELALGLTGGVVEILTVDGTRLRFSDRYAELDEGIAYPEITPSLFSYNSPAGACPRCDGLGVQRVFDNARLVEPRLSLRQGAVRPWARRGGAGQQRLLAALAEHFDIDLDTPFGELPVAAQIGVIEGTDAVVAGLERPFEGVRAQLTRRLRELEARAGDDGDDEPDGIDDVEAYTTDVVCPECEGERLCLPARMVRIGAHNIAALGRMPLDQLAATLGGLEFAGEAGEIAQAVLGQVRARLKFLLEVGVGYLTLDRPVMTLSGGESQRIRLATQVGAALAGITYVLDEPSIGLHPRDNDRLIATLLHLRDLGNTVIVVEHDEATMRASDWLVDMGPGAGPLGGRVVAAGPTHEVLAHPRSLTGAYLSGRMQIELPSQRRRPRGPSVLVRGARGHNLQDVTVRFPIGLLTVVTGVSGSGKSSLVIDTLLAEAARVVNGAARPPLPCDGVDGLEHIDKVIHVDQSPIGRSARSNPATYTGIFAELRGVFASLPDAKIRGWQPSRFSFNVKGGRCEGCQGEGVKRIEMQFLADLWVVCEVCGGKRYNRETLSVTMRGKTIADVLAMNVAEACDFFIAHPGMRQKLEVLRDVGLGYLALGQSALTLSGGEAQRIKLARELARKSTGRTLFVLDEPTVGLHFGDVKQLLGVLQRLVDEGNTVVVIEHDLDVIKSADHVIDIGPDGGSGGGRLVTSGTPEYVARSEHGHTAPHLAGALARAH
ncbi:MAG: excinuclease ABC subunit UvrA [Deltaproteobacteria bacterium]|nr:excinuclease ABC subunit UvrA [Deltaproteobacteria bacterium]